MTNWIRECSSLQLLLTFSQKPEEAGGTHKASIKSTGGGEVSEEEIIISNSKKRDLPLLFQTDVY